MKLGKSTGLFDEKLRESVVDDVDKKTDNGGEFIVWKRWMRLIHDTVFMIKKEIAMKNLLSTKHVPIGITTGLLVGLLWIAMLMYFQIMPLDEIKRLSMPFIFIS
ncbi:MAG TPA: hypothetical protein VFZ43_12190, partial [Anaerolineales bacterium]